MTTSCFGASRLLFVAPHPDDIAYSCGGLVAAHLAEAELHLLTVFSRSQYATARRARDLGEDYVTRTRAREDLAYCNRYGFKRYDLQLADSSLAGYSDLTELGADPFADDRFVSAAEAIAAAIRAIGPDVVVAPAAIGAHVDHAITHAAVRRAPLGKGRRLFYEDVPYVATLPLTTVDDTLRRAGLTPFHCLPIADVLALKIEDMTGYATQTDQGGIRLMVQHAQRLAPDRGACERLWIEVDG